METIEMLAARRPYHRRVELVGVIMSDYRAAEDCEVPLFSLTVLVGSTGVGNGNLIEPVGGHDLYGRLCRHGGPRREP
jgi:hypothetical protein